MPGKLTRSQPDEGGAKEIHMKTYIGEIILDGENEERLKLNVATNEQEIQSELHSDRAAIDLSMQAISLPFWANLAGMVVSMHQGLGVSFIYFALGCVLMVLVSGIGYVRQSLITFALTSVVRTGKPCTRYNKLITVLLIACLVLWIFGVAAFVGGVWAVI